MSEKQRAQILDAIRQRIEECFGPSGTEHKYFRVVRRGKYMPDRDPKRNCTVVDGGQQVDAHYDGEADLNLNVDLLIESEADFTRAEADADESELVEALQDELENWKPTGLGVTLISYVEDAPWKMPTGSGGSVEVRAVSFDVSYCRSFGTAEETAADEKDD